MNRLFLNKLLKVNEYPCVSILLKTYRTSPDNQKTTLTLKKLVKETEEKLLETMTKREAEPYINEIKKIIETVDVRSNMDGLALFVSKNFSDKVDLPFPVKDRVIIDKTFATRDIIKGLNRSTRYYILELSLHGARLFYCFRDEAIEVNNDIFPVKSEFDSLNLNPADISREKEKYIKEFFNNVDKLFQSIFKEDPAPLVLAGVKKNIAYYTEVCDNKSAIAGTLDGNYENAKAHEMGKLTWPIIDSLKQEERQRLIDELHEATGAHKSAFDISDLWRFAKEGRVNILIIEEDFEQKAYLNNKGDLILNSEDSINGAIEDAVDELAEIVMNKGGRVVFVEKGQLNDFGKIAGILRY
ncbi:MAG: hypothetical protein ACOCWC_00935 [Bacteroidota bacterium]